MRHKKGFYEVAPVAGFIARQDWTHTMERAERNGLSLQSQKGSTGLLFSVRILAPILDGGLRHIVLAAIQYSLGRHTYMPGIVAEFTCRNLSRLDEATRFTAVAEIRAHLNRYGEQEPYARLQATMRSRNVMATIILQNISQLKELFKDSWEGIIGNADAFVYLGGNEQSTHKYVSELLGKETIETRTSSQSRGRNGSYSQNFQQAGRELLTPDEVRMLDNRYALVLLRGEAPVIDEKYDLMRHPNIKLTADGGAAPYIHSPRCLYAEEDLDFIFTSLDDIEIIDEMEES